MKKNLVLWMVAVLTALAMSGCVAVVAAGGAAGGVAWVRGELQAQLDNNVTQVNQAVEKAGEDLKLSLISKEADLLGGTFTYRNAKDEKITIITEAQTTETSKLRIRIGIFGDQTQSQLILDKIKARL